MKNSIKSLSIIFVIFLFTATMASATAYSKEIKAILKPITVKTEASQQVIEVLFYQDHIYAPVRSVADFLKADIEWYGPSQTVQLTTNSCFKNFPEANTLIGERFVYGEIIDIDKNNYILTIEQHIDDNSIYLEPDINVPKDIVIILQRQNKKMNIDFEDLYYGDNVGIILDPQGQARGIILNS